MEKPPGAFCFVGKKKDKCCRYFYEEGNIFYQDVIKNREICDRMWKRKIGRKRRYMYEIQTMYRYS